MFGISVALRKSSKFCIIFTAILIYVSQWYRKPPQFTLQFLKVSGAPKCVDVFC